jgi:primosomal protein N'
MKILTVIPIAKGIPRDELSSIFLPKPVVLGTLVTVPFGKRSIKGVVVDYNEVRDLKSSIKTSDFALRNVTTVHSETLPASIFTTAQKTARFFAQSVGFIFKNNYS